VGGGGDEEKEETEGWGGGGLLNILLRPGRFQEVIKHRKNDWTVSWMGNWERE